MLLFFHYEIFKYDLCSGKWKIDENKMYLLDKTEDVVSIEKVKNIIKNDRMIMSDLKQLELK